ncbi:uncharacterized protein [Rutidosis leptorrhynchoides]|uniref:uncharacterized protein n=1 Tax=Rutidosis leptorrhynchoides TaxID=125765 RepID=UPI003A9A06DD
MSVNNHASVNLGEDHIIWEWVRQPSGRTLSEFHDLKLLLRDVKLSRDTKDSWKWSLAMNGLFTVKKLSSLIDAQVLGISNNNGEATCRNGLVPKKVELFVWHLLLNRLPVRLELDNRGINLHSVRCPVCDDGLESVEHSILSCRLAHDIWCRVFKWWNRGGLASLSLVELVRDSANIGLIWQGVTWVTSCLIWKNRNNMVFQNKSWSAPVALCEIQAISFDWISCKYKEVKIDWNMWLTRPSFYL